MKLFLKRMVMIIICAVVLFGSKIESVQAQSVGAISPRYVSLVDCWTTLSFSGETASVLAKVQGKDGTSNVSMVAVLQRQRGSSWVNVKTWEKSSASKSVRLQEVYPISSGTYRVMLTGTADGESTTVYSAVVTY